MVEKKEITSTEQGGSIKIADEVVGIIAGLAATEIEGVSGMSAGIVGGIAERLGRKNMSKGVKVEVTETEASADIYVIIEYGSRIPEVAEKVQENVKKAIETMTGLEVKAVNVHIQGISFPREAPKKTEE